VFGLQTGPTPLPDPDPPPPPPPCAQNPVDAEVEEVQRLAAEMAAGAQNPIDAEIKEVQRLAAGMAAGLDGAHTGLSEEQKSSGHVWGRCMGGGVFC